MPSYFSGVIQILVNRIRYVTVGYGWKKVFLFFFTLIVTILSFELMRLWTYVPTFTHFIGVFAPFAKDTTNNHFVTADINISTRDAFSLNEEEEEPYLIYHSCAFRFEERKKVPGITLAGKISPQILDRTWGSQGVFTDKANPNKKQYDGGRITNMGIFAHAFTSSSSNKIEHQPLEFRENIQNIDGKKSYQYYLLGIADTSLLKLPAFRLCRERLPNPYFEEKNGGIVPTLIQMATDSLSSSVFIANYVKAEKDNKIKRLWENMTRFFKPHNLSVSNYAFYCISDGVDSIHIKFSTTENSEFSLGTKTRTEIGRNYVAESWTGDTINTKGVSKLIHTTVRFQESENSQQVRLFFITTVCAASFGFFLKYLIIFIFYFLRITPKLFDNEKKK